MNSLIFRGAVDAPLIQFKCAGLTDAAATVISAGVNGLGSLLGFASNKSANNTNLEIARETNKQNYQMFKESQQFAQDMWDKQNNYNLPSEQVKRLLAAGINPAAVFGDGSLNNAGSVGLPNAPQLQSAQVRPYDFNLQGVGDSVNAYFRNQLLNRQVQSADVDTQLKRVELMFKASEKLQSLREQSARIDGILSNTRLSAEQREKMSVERKQIQRQLDLFNDTYDELVSREKKQNRIMDVQAENIMSDTQLKRLQGSFQSMVNRYYPKLTETQLTLMSSQAMNVIQQTNELVVQHKLTSEKAIAQHLENELTKVLNSEELRKYDIINGSNGTRVVRDFSNYASGLIFGNLKLFGK